VIEECEDAELREIYPGVVEVDGGVSHLESVKTMSKDQHPSAYVLSSTPLWDDTWLLGPERHNCLGS